MVVIEFFSETPIDNMISTLTSHPDKVILVGQSKIIGRMAKPTRSFWFLSAMIQRRLTTAV